LRNGKSRIHPSFLLFPIIFLATFDSAFSHEPNSFVKLPSSQRRELQLPIRNFRLIDQNGRPFDFKTVRDKIVVLAFAYTTCPDVCPLVTAAMKQVQMNLDQTERRAIYFLTVTTDPEVDTPKVLAAYAKRYGVDPSDWAFVTGDEAVLRGVWQNFGVRVVRKARGLVDHTSLTAVIDRGTMRFAYYGASPDPKVVIHDVRSLLGSR
jgi:protein SCO1